jgi:hypothetical protein
MHYRRTITLATAAVFLAGTAALAACEDDLAAKANSTCFSDLSDVTSPATGVLTLTGHFFDNESIIVRDASTHTQVASGTPATDRPTFTFTSIPSGSHSFDIIASCDNGQEDLGTRVVTVQ